MKTPNSHTIIYCENAKNNLSLRELLASYSFNFCLGICLLSGTLPLKTNPYNSTDCIRPVCLRLLVKQHHYGNQNHLSQVTYENIASLMMDPV